MYTSMPKFYALFRMVVLGTVHCKDSTVLTALSKMNGLEWVVKLKSFVIMEICPSELHVENLFVRIGVKA